MQVIDEGDKANMLKGLDVVLPFLIHLLETRALVSKVTLYPGSSSVPQLDKLLFSVHCHYY